MSPSLTPNSRRFNPFPDGNGPTGRVVVQRMLRNAGLTEQAVLPLSAGLLTDTDRYFAALVAYQAGDIVPIVESFIDAAFASMEADTGSRPRQHTDSSGNLNRRESSVRTRKQDGTVSGWSATWSLP
jgi:Fic family protein